MKHFKYGLETIGILIIGLLYLTPPMIVTCVALFAPIFLFGWTTLTLIIGLILALLMGMAFMSWYVEATMGE